MRVLCRMAGIAVDGGPLQDFLDMTICTGHFGMLSIQFENGKVVIKRGWCPTCCCVAGATISAKAVLVNIIRNMAGATILAGTLKISNVPGIDMALCTLDKCMFVGEFEGDTFVVKVFAVGIFPIVTGKAVNAVIKDVVLYESRILSGSDM